MSQVYHCLGFRGDEVDVPKPERTFRIACIGGSTTAEGHNLAETYPSLLGQQLRVLCETDRVEVVNCGIAGLTTHGQVARMWALDRIGKPTNSPTYLDLKPDLIVDYAAVNDVCWQILPVWKERLDQEGGWWTRLVRASYWLRDCYGSTMAPSDREIIADLEAVTLKNFRSLLRTAKVNDVELAFCTFATPDLSRLTRTEWEHFEHDFRTFWRGEYLGLADYVRIIELFNDQLADFCKREGVPLVPVAEELSGSGDVFIDICHMTIDGRKRKAEIIARHLAPLVRKRLSEAEHTASLDIGRLDTSRGPAGGSLASLPR